MPENRQHFEANYNCSVGLDPPSIALSRLDFIQGKLCVNIIVYIHREFKKKSEA